MTMENIFDIQSEITRQIVTAVKGELSETEQLALGAAPTSNLEAYEAYLHARAATNRADYSKVKYIEAQPWAEKAVRLDPEFAEAWAILTEIHGQAIWLGFDRTPERYAAGNEALAKALQLNPDSPSVIAAQGDHFYRFDNDYPKALSAYNKALQLAPGDARIHLYTAITLRRLGHWEDSISSFEKSMVLDPANVFTASQMIDTLLWMNELERVEKLVSLWIIKYPDSNDIKGHQIQAIIRRHGDLDTARELFDLLQPWGGNVYAATANLLLKLERDYGAWLAIQDIPAFVQNKRFIGDVGLTKGIIYHLMGDQDSARQHLQTQVDHSQGLAPTGSYVDAIVMSTLALSWSYLDEHEKALASSEKAMTMLPRAKDHIFGTILANFRTLMLARAGKRDEALERLAVNLDKAEGFTRWQLYLDPQWDFFRDDDRFNELVRPLNLKETGQ
jgi:tetratricopeptide (TPR) repeat protein